MTLPEKKRSAGMGAALALAATPNGHPTASPSEAPGAAADARRVGTRVISSGQFAQATADHTPGTGALPNSAGSDYVFATLYRKLNEGQDEQSARSKFLRMKDPTAGKRSRYAVHRNSFAAADRKMSLTSPDP